MGTQSEGSKGSNVLARDASCVLHIIRTVSPTSAALQQLKKLQHLKLRSFKLQLPGEVSSSRNSSVEGSSSGAQPCLPNLQHLELVWVELANVNSLLQLAKAPHLDTLSLTYIELSELEFSTGSFSSNNTEAALQHVAEAISNLLQHLPLLSVLRLPGFPFADAALQQKANMSRLQHIQLGHVENVPVADLQQLPSTITQLELSGKCYGPNHTPSLPPKLQQLSGLLHLQLQACSILPSVLSSVTKLQLLHLDGCRLLPDGHHEGEANEGTPAFLDVLPKLIHLQNLTMEGTLKFEGVAPQLFSALTTSSHLTVLDISRDCEPALPKGAVQCMFPASMQMPLLQRLTISTMPEGGP